MGVSRTERILGLHPRPCRRHDHSTLRVVSRRRWAINVGPVPVVAFDARWRTCAAQTHRFATPRFTVSTAVVVTLAALLAIGQGWVPLLHPAVWGTPLAFWGLWALGAGVDRALDPRLSPLPSSMPPPQRRSRRSVPAAAKRLVRGPLARVNRALRAVVAVGRRIRRRRAAKAANA